MSRSIVGGAVPLACKSHGPAALANPLVPLGLGLSASTPTAVPAVPPPPAAVPAAVRRFLAVLPVDLIRAAPTPFPMPRPLCFPPTHAASNLTGAVAGAVAASHLHILCTPFPSPSTSTWVAPEPCPTQQSRRWSDELHARLLLPFSERPCPSITAATKLLSICSSRELQIDGTVVVTGKQKLLECSDGVDFGEQLAQLQIDSMPVRAAAPAMAPASAPSPFLQGCIALALPSLSARMVEDAEEKGLISPGVTTLVEPTSGNMGIGLAYIAVLRGYKFLAVMPAEYSLDKQILLRYLGADVVLTDPTLGFQGQLDKVEQLKKEIPNVHVLDQFANAANPEAHFTWTGPEIWKDTAGKVDIFVAGSGTGGTISGVGKYLKMKNPAVKVICVEPAESPVISGGKPSRHKIQGVGPGFVPKNLDTSLIDEIITVNAEDAMANARRLAREEGLLVGISSGANFAASLKVASREENKEKMIVTVFPSGGERYTTSNLFAAVREECIAMTF